MLISNKLKSHNLGLLGWHMIHLLGLPPRWLRCYIGTEYQALPKSANET
jgi:hypothetical protein